MGVDRHDAGRADAMLLARLGAGQGPVELFTLPRHTRAEFPGHGAGPLNAAHAYGGPELAMQSVSLLLGVDVQHYVTLHLDQFRQFIDDLGGVPLEVERRMYYKDPQQNLVIDLEPGPQQLTGAQALQYAQFRLSADGRHDDDLTRGHRQQKLLKAILAQALAPDNWPKTSKLLSSFGAVVQTNLPAGDQAKLAQAVFQGRDRVTLSTLPGKVTEIAGAPYFIVDAAGTGQLLNPQKAAQASGH